MEKLSGKMSLSQIVKQLSELMKSTSPNLIFEFEIHQAPIELPISFYSEEETQEYINRPEIQTLLREAKQNHQAGKSIPMEKVIADIEAKHGILL